MGGSGSTKADISVTESRSSRTAYPLLPLGHPQHNHSETATPETHCDHQAPDDQLKEKTSTMFKTKIPAAIALGMIALTSIPANAHHNDEPTAEVSYGDLDLTTESGQNSLDHRLQDAVRKVCGNSSNIRSLRDRRQFESCNTTARQSFESTRRIAISNAQDGTRMADLGQSNGRSAG